MSPNENFILEVLQAEFGGEYLEGEAPPDGYLINSDNKIAVEVTRSVQKVKNESGKYVSRFEHDMPALTLADEMNERLSRKFPDNNTFSSLFHPL